MDARDEILTVLVLYEMKLEDSPAYQSLSLAMERGQKKSPLFVYDNSALAQSPPVTSIWSVCYYHDPTNPGVSRAYNHASSHAKSHHLKWLLFADQDTSFPENIYECYQQSISTYRDCHVFAPQLMDKKGIVSPFQPGAASGKRLKKITPGRKSMNGIQVVNSGLMVDRKIFESVAGYDERLRLDFSDFMFFRKLQLRTQHIVIIDAACKHELSSTEKISLRSALGRFKIYLQGSSVMGREESPVAFAFRAFLRAIKLSVRYRSIRFIGSFLSS